MTANTAKWILTVAFALTCPCQDTTQEVERLEPSKGNQFQSSKQSSKDQPTYAEVRPTHSWSEGPFESSSSFGVQHNQAFGGYNSGVPSYLKDAIKKSLAASPKHRPKTTEDQLWPLRSTPRP